MKKALALVALAASAGLASVPNASAAARCYFPTFSPTCSSFGTLTASANYYSSPTPVPEGISGFPYMFNQTTGTNRRIDRRYWLFGNNGTLQGQWYSVNYGNPANWQVPEGYWAGSSWVCVNIAGGTVHVKCGYVY